MDDIFLLLHLCLLCFLNFTLLCIKHIFPIPSITKSPADLNPNDVFSRANGFHRNSRKDYLPILQTEYRSDIHPFQLNFTQSTSNINLSATVCHASLWHVFSRQAAIVYISTFCAVFANNKQIRAHNPTMSDEWCSYGGGGWLVVQTAVKSSLC